jgi:hypothetical protein
MAAECHRQMLFATFFSTWDFCGRNLSKANLMKILIFALAAVFAFPFLSVRAASLEEETNFINSVKQAFEKHDADALVALTCWDKVPDKLKKDGKRQYAGDVAYAKSIVGSPIADIKLINSGQSNLEWKEDDDGRFAEIDPAWKETGVVYWLNLPVLKQLKITFAPTKADDKTSLTIEVTYPVGEKDGKLYFAEPAPVK